MTTTQIKKKHSARRKAYGYSSNIKIDTPIKKTSDEFTVSIAESDADKKAAYALAYTSYLEQGYIETNKDRLLVHDYDRLASTKVLIIKDQHDEVVGTITLVFSNDTKLPSGKVFDLKACNCLSNTVELSRLAVKSELKSNFSLFYKFVTWSYILSNDLGNNQRFIIEVNPKHVFFYQKSLEFEILADEAPCPMVGNAPAVLMSLPFVTILKMISNNQKTALSKFRDEFYEEEGRFLKHNGQQIKLQA